MNRRPFIMPSCTWPILALIALTTSSVSQSATTLYVSTDGDDRQAGSAQAPLRTLAGARDRVRVVKGQGLPVTVRFSAGFYSFDEPVLFGEEDSGTPDQSILYAAEPGAEVRLTGGMPVGSWQRVSDVTVLDRLVPVARSQVRVADLQAQGIAEYGSLAVRGFAAGSPIAEVELFFNDRPMTLARWPNAGFRGVAKKHSPVKVEVE